MFDQILYPPATFPPADVHSKHPFRNRASEAALFKYLHPRLMAAKAVRDSQLQRMYDVDRIVSTWLKATGEDFKRLQEERQTGEPQARKMILPVVFSHIDDILSYYLQVFCPNRGMFYSSGDAKESSNSDALVKFMNHNALSAGYYPHMAAALWSALKYNDRGGILMNWATRYGTEYQKTQDGTVQGTPVVLSQGNEIESFDPYNLLMDPNVKPHLIHKDGEFFAVARRLSPFEIRRRGKAAEYFNVQDVGTEKDTLTHGNFTFWAAPPTDYYMNAGVVGQMTGNQVNWSAWLTGSNSPVLDSYSREVIEVYIRINPFHFNLIPATKSNLSRNQDEIWKITLLGESVIGAEHKDNIHGHLPAYIGILHDDKAPTKQKSIAELMEPLQTGASFSMNAHIEGIRSNLYGTTYYDPQRVDYDKIKKGEVNARIPIKPAGYGQDIRTMVYHDNHNVDTSQTITDVGNMIDLAQKFFPSQGLPSQIASMDRAVSSQVAAVQQGANVRNQKGARMLDETMFCPLRIDMYMNIIQNFDGRTITDYDGSEIKLNVGALKSTDIQFIIGMGLKTLDRNFAASSMQSIIFACIQAPQVGQQLPLIQMIDHWTRMIDIDLNLGQFIAEQQATQTQPQEQQAPPGATDANGNPIQPMENPQAVTQPLTD